MCLERLTVRNGSMIRNIFGLFSCKNQGKNGYFPVMYSNKRTGYAKDKNLRNSKKKKKEIAVKEVDNLKMKQQNYIIVSVICIAALLLIVIGYLLLC